jgi:hypothetical protein
MVGVLSRERSDKRHRGVMEKTQSISGVASRAGGARPKSGTGFAGWRSGRRTAMEPTGALRVDYSYSSKRVLGWNLWSQKPLRTGGASPSCGRSQFNQRILSESKRRVPSGLLHGGNAADSHRVVPRTAMCQRCFRDYRFRPPHRFGKTWCGPRDAVR